MSDALIGPVPPPDLHVMTYNIRRKMNGPLVRGVDEWRDREPRMQRLLRAERPTLLGTQEVMPVQLGALTAALGPTYRVIGHGRERDGQGEGCPILYDTDRLELLTWQQLALSDEPATAGSRSWGNLVPRIAVSAEFRDRVTSARFLAINTHFDHISRASRVRAAEFVRRRIAAQSLPAVVTGDLNADDTSPALRELFAGDHLVDAWETASVRVSPQLSTYTNYRPPRRFGTRIDWIAVTPRVEVRTIGINAHRIDGRWPSDHLPVQTVLRFPTDRPPA
ncbi:endonuclease/exonuclease/phosphatase family protein [Microbacterium sp. cx-55]|uniref:endonuclease/exonuclease/phosphatase family protein n=1 Tax=Microbacterium sp. cx-55 TaxID=2875948 RepID=UPI001CBD4CA3|nr:endonuclease/exonuclease/phosphatase family protein [Microbacterium sp. cx-55]MBZ4486567.1 endonuclease/exonuclease/phosphatase family protein [Microbacterium sp. cx-55]UGB36465.1 endonuclease/exonuclease/phosphatase family protein [Microbacterium sp. cx-55]